MTTASQERRQIMRNIRAAHRHGEENVTLDFVLLMARITAKYLPKNKIGKKKVSKK